MQDCAAHRPAPAARTFTPYVRRESQRHLPAKRPAHRARLDFRRALERPRHHQESRPLTAQHFAEFEQCYGADPNGLGKRKDLGEAARFRRFSRSDIKARGYKLDVTWLKDDSLENSDDLPEPQDLAAEAITELEAVVDDLREIVALVEKEEAVEA